MNIKIKIFGSKQKIQSFLMCIWEFMKKQQI